MRITLPNTREVIDWLERNINTLKYHEEDIYVLRVVIDDYDEANWATVSCTFAPNTFPEDVVMSFQDVILLKRSIEKWERIINREDVDHGADDCALCLVYNSDDSHFPHCGGCPVAEKAGISGCRNTPYNIFCKLESDTPLHEPCPSEEKKAAEDMRDYLIEILYTLREKLNKQAALANYTW